MADRTIAIAFAPSGSTVSIHTHANPDTWATAVDSDGDGYIPQQIDDALGDSAIRIDAAGYRPYLVGFKFRNNRDNAHDPKPLNQQVNVGTDIPALVPVGPPLPPPGTLPLLDVQGRDFINAAGQREVLNGCDMFLAFRQFLSGADLTPFFTETRDLGFNMWRVFMQGSAAQNHVLQLSPTEPGYYDHVRPFADLLNQQGIVLLATIGVDNQDIHSDSNHWVRMYELLDGTKTIVSKANEWSKNLAGLQPSAFPNPPAGSFLLWSQGSDVGDKAPFKPAGPIIEFHPVRNYTTAMRDAVASPIELYEVQGFTQPLIIDEPGRMGTNAHDSRFSDPVEVWRYARLLSTLCAGVVMHNYFGQRGFLMDVPTAECARAWTRGVRG